MPTSRNLTGSRFGKLTVLEPTEKRADSGSIVWLCRCDCGNEREVSARRLQRGKVRSCGCLSNPPPKELAGLRFGRLTVLEYAGKERAKNTRQYWHCRCDCGNEVIVVQNDLQSGDTQSCGCLQKERACEALRLVDDTSVSILERTRAKPYASNTSGCTGVSQTKDGRWSAYISFQKRRYWLGRYSQKDDAIRARKRGEEMHDGFLEWYYSVFLPNQTAGNVEVSLPEGN